MNHNFNWEKGGGLGLRIEFGGRVVAVDKAQNMYILKYNKKI